MLNMSVIYDQFGYGDMAGLAENILDRIDINDYKADAYETLFHAMDEGMIYTDDQWTMIRYYCTPQYADFDEAWEEFENDLMVCLSAGVIEEDEEEEE